MTDADIEVTVEELPSPRPALACAVPLADPGSLAPTSCACCGEVAANVVKVSSALPGGQQLFVQYCDTCHAHVSAAATRDFAAALASVVLGLCVATALPVMRPSVGLGVHLLSSALAASAPVGVTALLTLRKPKGAHVRGRAVVVRGRGTVVCANPAWGEALASLHAVTSQRVRWREFRASLWMLLGPCVALLAALFFHWLHHPRLRVVNLGDDVIWLSVDDGAQVKVQPSSAESPTAGIELRVAAGWRSLEVRSPEGELVERQRVKVLGGAEHLYAPRSQGFCFWLESRAYGQVSDAAETRVPLRGDSRFWALPVAVDSWFLPNPEANPADFRSTGGILTSLRQAPCKRAPPGVGSTSR